MPKLNNILFVAFLLANCLLNVTMHLHRVKTGDQYSSRFQKILNLMRTIVEEASMQPNELKRETLSLVASLLREMGKLIENSRAQDKTSDFWYMRPG